MPAEPGLVPVAADHRSTDLDGLHDVSVVIESRRTGREILELRTLLFEVPSDTVIKDRDRQRERDATSRRREGGGGGRKS